MLSFPVSASLIVQSTTTAGWTPQYCSICNSYDNPFDAQQGQGELEIVGTSAGGTVGNEPAFFTAFIPGVTSTDGELAFRVRLAGDGPGNGSFDAVFVVGLDIGGDGTLDLMVGVDNSGGGAGEIKIWHIAGATGPADIAFSTPWQTYAETSTNYAFRLSTPGDGLDGNGSLNLIPPPPNDKKDFGQDWILSFSLDFNQIVQALADPNRPGGPISISSNTIIRYFAFTSENDSVVNGDYTGCNGTSVFTDCLPPPAPINVPEPASVILTGAGFVGLAVMARLRRRI